MIAILNLIMFQNNLMIIILNSFIHIINIKVGDLTAIEKRMKLVTKFEILVSPIVTTSNMKTSVRLCNIIIALVQTMINTKHMSTCRSVNDIIWTMISEFCFPKLLLVNPENPSLKVTKATDPIKTVRNILRSTGAIKDVRHRRLYNELISRCDEGQGLELYNAQIYTHKEHLFNFNEIIPVLNSRDVRLENMSDKVAFPAAD